MKSDRRPVGYRDAGVDIDAGNLLVRLIKDDVAATIRPGVIGGLGGFGGLFTLEPGRYREPVLVAGTDGVGTKLKIAIMLDRHDTIGIDLVAMCVNDVLVQGAEPLFFLDYLAVGKLVPEKAALIVKGIAEGCRQGGCALLGGETAEMPGFYGEDEYDLAGFVVGIVEKDRLLDGSRPGSGDVLIGLPSTGLHSNGYSLARKVLLEEGGLSLGESPAGFDQTLGEMLLEPTRIYVPQILPLLSQFEVKAMAHITGGGLIENIPRSFGNHLDGLLVEGSWPVPPLFQLIAELGPVEPMEMYRTFNMGIGFVLIVSSGTEKDIVRYFQDEGQEAYVIGSLVPGKGRTIITS